MRGARAALERLCAPEHEVSAHYLIAADGTLWQLVDETMRAWHAGVGCWDGAGDVNSRSVGIELDNAGDHPFAAPQMAVLERLLGDIMARHAMGPRGVIGHSDMAPGRKVDPGPRFDWARLERCGLAAPAPRSGAAGRKPDMAVFRACARAAGYTADAADADLLAAVRLRHRPGARGPLAPEDMALW